jgi:hypothetical protein
VRLGDPCLNGLWFPLGTRQTAHTHPSVRIGMVDDGVPAREIQKRLGMEREEVTRLVNRAGMPAQVTKGRAGALNRAWVPGKG